MYIFYINYNYVILFTSFHLQVPTGGVTVVDKYIDEQAVYILLINAM